MKIYLLSPYSHERESIRYWRWSMACEHAGKLMAAGFLVYSPIAHTHSIAVQHELPLNWEYWKALDTSFIRDWCDIGVILELPGWRESVGVNAELQIFGRLGKRVYNWTHQEDLPYGLKARVR